MALRRLFDLRRGEIPFVTDYLLPFLAAFLCAIVSAWGVGGGTLLLLVMTLFLGVEQETARGINLLFFLPTAASALLCHIKGGYVEKKTFRAAAPFALGAALLGAWAATVLPTQALRKPFGVYLLLSAAGMLWPKKHKKSTS
ncbi:MAG: TSUP family transporter [Oscillibacter sp.]|nr:TSUP family transporter [Oscillibacter sp.]